MNWGQARPVGTGTGALGGCCSLGLLVDALGAALGLGLDGAALGLLVAALGFDDGALGLGATLALGFDDHVLGLLVAVLGLLVGAVSPVGFLHVCFVLAMCCSPLTRREGSSSHHRGSLPPPRDGEEGALPHALVQGTEERPEA